VPPVLALPDIGFLHASALAGVQLDDAGPHVRAADVDRQNGVVASQDPRGRKLYGADEARLVRMVLDRAKLDRNQSWRSDLQWRNSDLESGRPSDQAADFLYNWPGRQVGPWIRQATAFPPGT
jgi:hypothetical protein